MTRNKCENTISKLNSVVSVLRRFDCTYLISLFSLAKSIHLWLGVLRSKAYDTRLSVYWSADVTKAVQCVNVEMLKCHVKC